MKRALRISAEDNVAVSLDDLDAGDQVAVVEDPAQRVGSVQVDATEGIPFAHKIALAGLGEGDLVIKFGLSVGRLTQDVAKGGLVHVHNLRSERGQA